MKKSYFIIALAVILLLVTGCLGGGQETANKEPVQEQTPEQTREQEGGENQRPGWNDNFSEGNLSDLNIGQRVLVMGTENDDGSVSADRIMIGDIETDFNQMGRGMPSRQEEGDSNDLPNRMPQMPEGEQPNFEQFQNMTEEERVKFREERMVQRGTGGMMRTNNSGQNIVRLNGEIIDQDNGVLTLKLEDGGSKLVFFSESTNILKIKE